MTTEETNRREFEEPKPCILERDKNGIIRIKHCEDLFIADREAFQKLLDERNDFLTQLRDLQAARERHKIAISRLHQTLLDARACGCEISLDDAISDAENYLPNKEDQERKSPASECSH
jgi:hypothetical protein